MQPKKSIEYSEATWNPYSGDKVDDGKCEIVNRYGPKACWACGMAYRLRGRAGYDYGRPFQPTFHPDKLDIPLKRKKPTIWATCFMGDISYCAGIWWDRIIGVIKKCPQHTFILLTKRPAIFRLGTFSDNVWFGTTINIQNETYRLDVLKEINCKHKWISFEPPYETINCELTGLEFIAIGAQTGNHPFQPQNEAVELLIHNARVDNVKVIIKDNLDYEPKASYEPWEWP